MKQILLLSFFIFSLGQAQNHQSAETALIHNERNAALARMHRQSMANSGNYDVVFNRLDLHIANMSQRQLSGTITTYYKPNSNLNNMEFDFTQAMQVQSVMYHGNSLNFSQSNNVLNITFNNTQQAGVLDSISVNYSGNVPSTGMGSYNVENHNNIPVIWTLSEPYGARDWWPCKQDLTDKIDSLEVRLHYPASVSGQEMKGISNGLLQSETVNNDVKTSVWKSRYPIAAYLVAFAITNYQKFSYNAGISQAFYIDNYSYPEDYTTNSVTAQSIVPVMNYYEQKFGPYPFRNEKYGQIQFGWGGGMEHQTATFIVNYSRPLTAHELAHQWFGDYVTCGSWQDIWLNEGFATYCEALTREHLDGQTSFDSWKQAANNQVISSPGGAVYVSDTTSIYRIFDSRLSYKKGAMVLNMLRLKMGDTDFFQGIKNYLSGQAFSYAKTPDLQSYLENQSGQSLQEFFNDWVYGEGYPTYTFDIIATGTPHQYQITVHQSTSHSSVSFFEMPLPFAFGDGNGLAHTFTLDNTFDGQQFTIDIGFTPTQVAFDPHYDIVKGHTTLNTTLSVKNSLANSFGIYPNPTNGLLHILNNSDAKIDKIEILTLTGKNIRTIKTTNNLIYIKDLSNGAYLIKIYTDKGSISKKIVKE